MWQAFLEILEIPTLIFPPGEKGFMSTFEREESTLERFVLD